MRRFLKSVETGIAVILSASVVTSCRQVPPVQVFESPSPTISPHPVKVDTKGAAKLRQSGLRSRRQGRYAEAIGFLEKAVDLDPDNLSGQVLLGWTFHLAGRESAAQKSLQRALERDPDYIQALNALGIVYLVKGDLSSSVATHQRAIKLEPDNEVAHYNLTLAYHRLGQYDLAISQGKRATALEPGNPHPWVALALVYWDQGEIPKAQQTYAQAVQLDSRYRRSEFLADLKLAGFSLEQVQTVRQILKSRQHR